MSNNNEFDGTIREFLQGVKNGDIRGSFVTEKTAENIVIEISVGPFEFGRVHLRAIVDEPRETSEEGMHYRRLYKYENKYQEVNQTVQDIVESENETEITNAHEWKVKDPDKPESFPFMPRGFNEESTIIFEETIALRDDVSLEEAIMTNRANNKAED